MAFVSVTTLGAGQKGRALIGKSGIHFAVDKSKRAGVVYMSVRLRISSDLAKLARYIEGDRVDVLFDSENHLGLIVRKKNGPLAFSRRGGLSRGQHPAETTPYSVKFTWRPGMPLVDETSECTEVKLTDDGIIFKLPENAIFTTNDWGQP